MLIRNKLSNSLIIAAVACAGNFVINYYVIIAVLTVFWVPDIDALAAPWELILAATWRNRYFYLITREYLFNYYYSPTLIDFNVMQYHCCLITW